MKNFLMCALLICAIPALAFAQVNVECEGCTHEVSVYRGTGGFIATADLDDEDGKVSWVATCGGVTTSGELEPNDDDVVSGLFSMANGLACNEETSQFQIGPVMDGGWFWINDEENSAVGNLVDKDILKNEKTPITSAGDSVTMTPGKGAVFLKHATNGRVGLLPNILPEPPVDPVAICGPTVTPGTRAYTSQRSLNCMLGNGGTKVRVSGTDHLGRAGVITSGMVTRPATIEGSTASVVLTVDLWVNETGSYSTDPTTPANGVGPANNLGWVGKGTRNWLNAVWTASVGGRGATVVPPTADGHGVVVTDGSGTTPPGQATVTITQNSSYCPASPTAEKFPLEVTITAAAPSTANEVHPPVGFANRALAAGRSTKITVVCPSASAANQGVELVPENPFPPTFE